MGLGEIDRRGFFGFAEIVATFITELAAWLIGMTTGRARNFQFSPALLTKFGTFSVIKRKARTGRNPKTGDEIKIPVRHYARFKAGCDLREAAKACTVK